MRRGLTLAEVVLAIGLLVVVILGLVGLIGSGLRLQRQSKELTQATQVARTFLEEVGRHGFGSIPDAGRVYDGRSNDARDPDTGFPPLPYPKVEVEGREYTLVVGTATHDSKRRSVKIEVYWETRSRVVLETSFVP